MKQPDINPDKIVKVKLTGSAKALQPTVYKDGDLFFCLLGASKNGVLGSGTTIDDAISDWDKNLQTRLNIGDQNDDVVKMVIGLLNEQKQESSRQIDDFFLHYLRPYKGKG